MSIPKNEVLTIRLDAKLLKRIDAMTARRYDLLYGKDTSRARPPLVSRPDTVRWLIEVGLHEEEKALTKREALLKGGR